MTTTLPLTIVPDLADDGAASVFVDVEIDGERLPFLLDTGAAISRTSAGRRGRPPEKTPTPTEPSQGALGGRPPTAGTTMIDTLTWGTQGQAIRMHGIEMEATEDSVPGPAHILGLDVLAAHRLDLSYSAGRLVVDAPGRPKPTAPLVLSSHGHPHIEFDWDDVRVRALIDTGASVSIVDSAFAAAHTDLFHERGLHVGTDAYGASSETPMILLTGPRIGGRMFTPSVAAIAPIRGIQPSGDPEFDIIFGHPLLSQADWSFDLPGGSWAFLD